MSKRIVDDPSQHGWTDVGGKWMWAGSGSGGGSYDDTELRGLIANNADGVLQNATDIAALQALPHVDAYTKAESDNKYSVDGHGHTEYQLKGDYAVATHTHTEYQLKGDYAIATHTHTEYVPKSGNTTVTGILTAKDVVATG